MVKMTGSSVQRICVINKTQEAAKSFDQYFAEVYTKGGIVDNDLIFSEDEILLIRVTKEDVQKSFKIIHQTSQKVQTTLI
jgi:hypothetical protein